MQCLSCFIDFVSKHSVTRPIQDSREFVVVHSAESSRTTLTTESLSFIGSLRIPAQSRLFQCRHTATEAAVLSHGIDIVGRTHRTSIGRALRSVCLKRTGVVRAV